MASSVRASPEGRWYASTDVPSGTNSIPVPRKPWHPACYAMRYNPEGCNVMLDIISAMSLTLALPNLGAPWPV
jgi:hypothetical protein